MLTPDGDSVAPALAAVTEAGRDELVLAQDPVVFAFHATDEYLKTVMEFYFSLYLTILLS